MVYLYIADEGVWGELLKAIGRRLGRPFKIINIQHGLFTLRIIRTRMLRRFVNWLFGMATGYPLVGMDFGGSQLDVYFVYGDEEKKFIQARSPRSTVITSPTICKYELMKKVGKIQAMLGSESGLDATRMKLLFAAQINDINPDCTHSEEQIAAHLQPLFRYLKEKGCSVYYRLHPAIMDTKPFIDILDHHGILQDVIMCSDIAYEELLAKTGSTMSLQSTVLYDGFVVGKMPVVVCGFTKNFSFTVPHESVNMMGNWKKEIDTALDNIGSYYKDIRGDLFEPEVLEFFSSIRGNKGGKA
ncbi:MAG TPA: hypothetical protein VK470_13695 [Bacteroidota bacterium]|nr:hypothetical protein [Bacteroidota bacterium]